MPTADFESFVDHLVLRGRRLFGWGWAAHARLPVERVTVRIWGRGWDVTLPCSAGLARPDVAENHPGLLGCECSGFVVTGFIPDGQPIRLQLVVDFEDGLFREIDITPSVRRLSQGESRWQLSKRLAKAAWRRVRQGDLRGIVNRLRERDFAPPSLDEPAGMDKLIGELLEHKAPCLVFDNSLGGGSNHFRRRLVSARARDGQPVVLCTYNLALLHYRVQLIVPGREELPFALSSPLVLGHLLDRLPVQEIFVNSPVSFDDPVAFSEWLSAMRARHPATRLTLTAHDFFAACPSFVLLDADNRFCDLPAISECEKCLARHGGGHVALSPPSDIREWRRSWGRAMAAADEVRSFSASTRKLLMRAYPQVPAGKFTVVPHDMEYFDSVRPRIDASAPLVIGIVGEITLQKGAFIVREMVSLIERRGDHARIVVIGDLNSARRSPVLTVTGAYKRDQLVRLIEDNGVNMVLFPSIWPETFSYVVGELTHMGVPIVAFDLGAPAERLRTYALARLVEKVSAEAALDTAIAFHRERSERPASAA